MAMLVLVVTALVLIAFILAYLNIRERATPEDKSIFWILAGSVIFALLFVWGFISSTQGCIRSHQEERGSYATLVPVGKGLLPVYHPAGTVTVCDERE